MLAPHGLKHQVDDGGHVRRQQEHEHDGRVWRRKQQQKQKSACEQGAQLGDLSSRHGVSAPRELTIEAAFEYMVVCLFEVGVEQLNSLGNIGSGVLCVLEGLLVDVPQGLQAQSRFCTPHSHRLDCHATVAATDVQHHTA